jgi:predicted HAD superfamily Cof-like phosphohydrolase
MVREWHEKFGSIDPTEPTLMTPEKYELRKRLIEEEYEEFRESYERGDLVNAFKELADLIYVVAGTGAAMGGDLDAVFDAVQESNMSKLGRDGKPVRREDGKILKGPDYKEPDVKRALGLV